MQPRLSTAVLLLLVLLPAAAPLAAQEQPASCEIEILEPQPGQQVGSRITVYATATLPAGHHVWVFARRIDFEPHWWPQGEMSLKPESGKWRGFASIGVSLDVGWDFNVAVAVFASQEHLQLREYLKKAIDNKDWSPIEMPAAACPPAVVTITKAHE
jgi:hypothetical protein